MRTLGILVIVTLLSLFGLRATSQTVFLYQGVEDQLSSEQLGEISTAQGFVEKAEASIKKAEGIEASYADKKKKEKKYEKKIWEAKKFRIDAEVKYSRGFSGATTVYSAFINEANFYLDSDKEEAKRLDSEAIELMGTADNQLSKLKKVAGEKKALEKMSSSKLGSELASSHKLIEDALEKQFKAMELYLKQADKKKYDEKDRQAWDEAQSINTVEAYEEYVTNFSRGKNAAKAREKIEELRKEPEVVVDSSDQVNPEVAVAGITFKVQIAASKIPLSHAKLSALYSQTDQIERQRVGGQYKYRVGNFKSYGEAAKKRDQMRVSGAPDAFIVAFDKKNTQIPVTDAMKK
jgi:hypothetical protein